MALAARTDPLARRRGTFAPRACARAPRAAPAAAISCALLVAALSAAGCRSSPPAGPAPGPVPESETSPAWVRQPLSWEKLDSIEAWLAGAFAAHDPSLRLEALLQLAEGRLRFGQRDLERVPTASLRVRMEAARDGFGEVLQSPVASPGQRTRAEIGLRACAALLGAPARSELAILPRGRWGAQAAVPSRMSPLKGSWSRITVHHSAEGQSNPDGASLEDSVAALRLVQRYHMDEPDHRWGDIGYHFLIDSAGRIFEGRELRWQGAHAGGQNNHQNIGVCLLGDYEHRPPSEAALESLRLLLRELRERYRIPASRVHPHNDFGGTVCPGQPLTSWLRRYG